MLERKWNITAWYCSASFFIMFKVKIVKITGALWLIMKLNNFITFKHHLNQEILIKYHWIFVIYSHVKFYTIGPRAPFFVNQFVLMILVPDKRKKFEKIFDKNFEDLSKNYSCVEIYKNVPKRCWPRTPSVNVINHSFLRHLWRGWMG